MPRPPALIMPSKLSRANGNVPDAASAPNRQAEIRLLFLFASASMSKAMVRLAATPAASIDHGRIGGGVARLFLLGSRIETMRRGDQGGAVGRHQAAQHGAAGLHQFGRQHHVDFAWRRHQRQDRRAAGFGRQHLDIIDRRAGALGDAGHRGRLGVPALRLGEFDDPVGQHAAALAAHRHNGDADRPLGRVPRRCYWRAGEIVHECLAFASIGETRSGGLRGGAAGSRSPSAARPAMKRSHRSDCG